MPPDLLGPRPSNYDLTFVVTDPDDASETHVQVMLYREPTRSGGMKPWSVTTQHVPTVEAERFRDREVGKTWDDGSKGSFFSRQAPDGTVAYCLGVYQRSPGLWITAGALTEITVPSGSGAVRATFETVDNATHLFFICLDAALKVEFGTASAATLDNDWGDFSAYSATNVAGTCLVGGEGGGIWRRNGASGVWDQSTGAGEVRRRYVSTLWWFFPQDGEERGTQKVVGVPTSGGPTSYVYPLSSLAYIDPQAAGADLMDEADWTDADTLPVGLSQHSVTGLASTGQNLVILKTNGVHTVDNRLYAPNSTTMFQSLISNSDIHPIVVAYGYIWVGHDQGMYRIPLRSLGTNVHDVEWCYQGSPFPNETPIFGKPVAIAPSPDGWVGVLIFNGTDTYLCYCADRARVNIPGPGPVVWVGSETMPVEGLGTSLTFASPVQDSYVPRAWISWVDGAGATRIGWQALPRHGSPYQDLLVGGPMVGRFAEEGFVYFPSYDWGNPDWSKDLESVAVRSGDEGSPTITLSAAVDGGDTYADLGSTTSTYEEFRVTDIVDIRDLVLRARLDGTASLPAVLRSVTATATVTVQSSPVLTIQFWFGHGIPTRSGTDTRTTDEIRRVRALVERLRGQRVTCYDHLQRATEIRVHQDMRIDDVEDTDHGTSYVVVTAQYTITDQIWYLDDGEVLDSGRILL